ncbi:MAG TPA: fused MFS/spermidine synthase [Vicinamibacterales bacterium]|nr:fused MFS/spermidine synthase [Vicinamibacterales bacterium]
MRRLFCVAYFLSGCAGLLYEIVWTRLLTLHLGHTVAAVSTVLAAFLGGLALGALAGGRLAARRTPRAALRTYAALEVAIAASAFVVPLALLAFRPMLAWAYGTEAPGVFFVTLRIVTSAVVLVVPAMAMGATFPVATAWFVDEPGRAGTSAGWLYAVNTAGGAIGATLAAFVLVPLIGLRVTTLAAVSLNLIAAGLAWTIARDTAVETAPGPARPARAAASRGIPKGARAPADLLVPTCIALAVTGFAALANEVAWTRILAMVLGPTTYAFGVMVSVFITGLALGSAAMARLVTRIERPALALAVAIAAVAAAPAAVMATVEPLALRVARVAAGIDTRFIELVANQALAAVSLLLPLTLALGAAFPLGIQLATRTAQAPAARIAAVYAANTAGAIAGALFSGFLLIPWLGLQRTLLAVSAIALTAALASLVAARPGRRDALAGTLAILVAAGVIWSAPGWDTDLLSSGAYKYAAYVRTADLVSAMRAGTVLYYREGAAATVSVRRLAGTRALAIDGKVDASNGGDMLTQKLLAHLPLLLHPHPRAIAIIGLGSGVTLGAGLTHPIERADTVEISPEVVRASEFFQIENKRALSDPRSHLIVGDGRSHVMLTGRQYDVIISEPSNPWMAGVAALFTREFFVAARHALNPDGILCQWAHTYDISDADLRSIAATFQSVFPEGTMWLVGESDLLLIGSPAGTLDRLAGLGQAFGRPNVAADLDEVGVRSVDTLLSTWVGGPKELAAYASGRLVQTDDRMRLEFTAPRSLVGKPAADNAAVLRALATPDGLPALVRAMRDSNDPVVWRDRGRMLLKAEAYSLAFEALSKAVSLAPADDEGWTGFVDSAAATGHEAEALRRLREIAGRLPLSVMPHIELSKILASMGNTEDALEAVRPLMVSLEHDPRAFEQAASVLADAGDAGRLNAVVAQLQARWPARASSRYYAAVSALLEGRFADSLRISEDAATDTNHDPRLFNVVGAAAANLGRRDEARRAFQTALQHDPRDSAAYVNLGLVELEAGDRRAALRWFAEALVVDPESRAAQDGLARARAPIR